MVTRREAALLSLAAIASIPATRAIAAELGGLKSGTDPDAFLQYVDPELRAFLRTIPPEKPVTAAQVRQWRANPDADAEALPAGVVARSVPGPPGAPEVRIFIAGSSDGGRSRPAILYTHGGGY